MRGVSVIPPGPVHLHTEVLPGGDARIRWVRRSRSGWRWIDGVDAPLAEEQEAYRVTIDRGDGVSRTVETAMPEVVIAAADRNGGPATIRIRQIGSNGESIAIQTILPSV